MHRILSSKWMQLAALATGMGMGGGYIIKQRKEEWGRIKCGEAKEYNFQMENLSHLRYFDRRKLKARLRKREEHLSELKSKDTNIDVLIIGGGATGAGVLLDGSMRGLKCALIEKGDFASATSSKSTKLIHGGIRYLEQFFKLERGFIDKIKLVVESLDERNYMLNSAPYMNKSVKMVVPCKNIFYLIYYYVGVNFYHFISFLNFVFSRDYTLKLPRPQFVSKRRMKELFPLLKRASYGVLFCEGQMDDARAALQSMLTVTAEHYIGGLKPAIIANYTSLFSFIYDKDTQKISGAILKDETTGRQFEVRCKSVINCTGPYADNIRLLDDPSANKRMVGSRGVHLVLPKYMTPHDVGLVVPKTKDGRIMFNLPYKHKYTISGTTDHPNSIDPMPMAPHSDIQEILAELKNYYDMGDHPENQVLSAWSGIRPLVLSATPEKEFKLPLPSWMKKSSKKEENKESTDGVEKVETKRLTRNHEIEISDSGLISVLGGKWTTYRKMGADTIDKLLSLNIKGIEPVFKKSISSKYKLLGSYTNLSFEGEKEKGDEYIPVYEKYLVEEYGLGEDTSKELVRMYGSLAVQVAELGHKDKSLLERINPQLPYIKAQIIYAMDKELAIHATDVIYRRLGIAFLHQEIAIQVAQIVVDIMAKQMKWTSAIKNKEINMVKDGIKHFAN